MEALFDTCKQLVIDLTKASLASEVYAEEATKLTRYVAKVALVVTEIELHMRMEQSLRGSQSLFRAVDGMIAALKQVQQLMQQCSSARGGGVWPLEDAVEFQAVALELQNALLGLTKVRDPLPPDVCEDLQHFVRQLGGLQFTTSELAETEEAVENALQGTPRAGPAGEHVAEAPGGRPGQGRPPRIQVQPPAQACEPTAGAPEGGAGEEEGEEEEPSSPLPDDPFNMGSRLAPSPVRELEGLQLLSTAGAGEEGGGVSLGEESLLEARADNQDVLLSEASVLLQHGARPAGGGAEALRGLQQLAQAGRGGLEGIRESPEEGGNDDDDEKEELDGEEEKELGALVDDVVAMVEEVEAPAPAGGQPRGRQEGAGAGFIETAEGWAERAEGTAAAGPVAEPEAPPDVQQAVKRQLSPASALAELAQSSLEHLAQGD